MKIIAANGTSIDHRKARRGMRHALKICRSISKSEGVVSDLNINVTRSLFRHLRLLKNRPGKYWIASA